MLPCILKPHFNAMYFNMNVVLIILYILFWCLDSGIN